MSCCGINNNCQCNRCEGVRMAQFAVVARAASAQKIVLSDNTLLEVSSLVSYLGLTITDRSAKTFNSTTNTGDLDDANDYACTDTTSARTLTLSTSTILLGSSTKWFYININDQTGGAGTNNITIDTEGSQLIDGVSSINITADYGSLSLYTDGSNVFTVG